MAMVALPQSACMFLIFLVECLAKIANSLKYLILEIDFEFVSLICISGTLIFFVVLIVKNSMPPVPVSMEMYSNLKYA
jgi:hypothetical protein